VFGPNEQGKTLLIDAILKMLFKNKLGRNAKLFGNLERVDEQPEGFIVLDINGDDVKLERRKTLMDLVDLTPVEFRNVFVVRDSELGVHEPGANYTRISEKLAGLETTRIQKIKEALQNQGRLTNPSSTAGLADNVNTEHIKGRIRTAAACLEDIESLHRTLKSQGFDTLERALVDLEAELDAARTELGLLRKAETHQKFTAARKRLAAIAQIDAKLEHADGLKSEDLDAWKQAERDLARLIEESKEISGKRAKNREESARLENRKSDLRGDMAGLDDTAAEFDDRLASALDEFEALSRRAAADEPRRKTWGRIALACSVMLVGSMAAAAFQPAAFYAPIAAVLFLVVLLAGWRFVAGRSVLSKLAEAAENIRLISARFGIDDGKPESVRRYRLSLEKKRSAVRSELEHVTEKCIEHDKRDELNAERAGAIRERSAECRRIIGEITHRSGMSSVDDMKRALDDKAALGTERQRHAAVLTEQTGVGADRDGNLDVGRWRAAIEEYFGNAPEGADTLKYDKKREQALAGKVTALENETADIRSKLEWGKDALSSLEGRIGQARPFGAHEIACRSVDDLVRSRDALAGFVERIERDKENALLALDVFEDIEAEEKSRVLDLFGPDAGVSAHFERITRGRYIEVSYDLASAEITVVANDGEAIQAKYLSGGALDQLHFAVRLSIGERMFTDGCGLLILDDPFIKSDRGRLDSQLTLLREAVAGGWQVIYFSAKEEIKAALTPDIASGSVGIFEIGVVRSESPKPA
jgi:DNA repair exonuclease SbcCD ATPase subunit